MVEALVAWAQHPQYLHRLFDGRLTDFDWLEGPLQRWVALDRVAVVVERGRADALEFTARQHRLEEIAGVDRAFGNTGAGQRLQLVYEQDHVGGADDLVHDLLEPLFEVA